MIHVRKKAITRQQACAAENIYTDYAYLPNAISPTLSPINMEMMYGAEYVLYSASMYDQAMRRTEMMDV